ncbi:uncharacterized protein LOC143848864 [Tasmannia lanceolata]|uniref:uncharacterized protein LOC143848864 n=1 Tax=Tasmannia lanceolata TaxID=3420 RepID=UPI00406387DD
MSKPNLVSYNSMISGLTRHGHHQEAISVFRKMQKQSENPLIDKFTLVSISSACAGLTAAKLLRQVHGVVIATGLELNLIMCNALVDSYGKCGDADSSRRVFDQMLVRDVVLWTSLVVAYMQACRLEEACWVFDQMPFRNSVSWTALVSRYAQNGHEEKGSWRKNGGSSSYHKDEVLQEYVAHKQRTISKKNTESKVGASEKETDLAQPGQTIGSLNPHGNLPSLDKEMDREGSLNVLMRVDPNKSQVGEEALMTLKIPGEKLKTDEGVLSSPTRLPLCFSGVVGDEICGDDGTEKHLAGLSSCPTESVDKGNPMEIRGDNCGGSLNETMLGGDTNHFPLIPVDEAGTEKVSQESSAGVDSMEIEILNKITDCLKDVEDGVSSESASNTDNVDALLNMGRDFGILFEENVSKIKEMAEAIDNREGKNKASAMKEGRGSRELRRLQ